MEKFSCYLTTIPIGDYYYLAQGRTAQQLLIPRRIFDAIRRNLNRKAIPQGHPALYEQLLRKCEIVIDKEIDEEERLKAKFLEKNPGRNQMALALTMRCNFACRYCYEQEKRSDMSREVINKALNWFFERVKREEHFQIQFYGGEPLLCRDKIEYTVNKVQDFTEATGIGHSFFLFTNGSLFDKKYLKIFSQANLSGIHVTIDGSREAHDRRRFFKNGAPSYDLIMRNLPLMSESCRQLEVAVTIDRDNYRSIPLLFRELKKMELPNLILKLVPVRESFGRSRSWGKSLGEEYGEFAKKLLMEATQLKLKILGGDGWPIKPRFHFCIASAVNPFVIGPRGEIYTCYELVGVKEAVIGNLTTGLDEARVKQWRKYSVIEDPACKKCRHIFFCGGRCMADLKYGFLSAGWCGIKFKKYLESRLQSLSDKELEQLRGNADFTLRPSLRSASFNFTSGRNSLLKHPSHRRTRTAGRSTHTFFKFT